MAISLDNLRRGRNYKLTNYGETFEFMVMEIPDENVYKVKDLNTLDTYLLHELYKYGKGKDFDLEEL